MMTLQGAIAYGKHIGVRWYIRNDRGCNHELFDIRDELEYEANVFAANLLIDDGEMIDFLEEGYNVVATASSLDVNVNLLMLKLIEMNKQQGFNFQLSEAPERCFMGSIQDSNAQDW